MAPLVILPWNTDISRRPNNRALMKNTLHDWKIKKESLLGIRPTIAKTLTKPLNNSLVFGFLVLIRIEIWKLSKSYRFQR